MAILKHISSKNADYGDAEKYLTFEHDEFTMKPTLDADGRLIPRADYRISSLMILKNHSNSRLVNISVTQLFQLQAQIHILHAVFHIF